jgi:hypothetical protein
MTALPADSAGDGGLLPASSLLQPLVRQEASAQYPVDHDSHSKTAQKNVAKKIHGYLA